MAAKRHFRKIATSIRYHGVSQIKWYQKIFFKPPRTFIGPLRTTRSKAEAVRVPNHTQFGITFKPMVHTEKIERVTKC